MHDHVSALHCTAMHKCLRELDPTEWTSSLCYQAMYVILKTLPPTHYPNEQLSWCKWSTTCF